MNTNITLNTDSYKLSHWLQYPPKTEKVFSYIESRGGRYAQTTFFGLQMFLKEYLSKPVTMGMVEEGKRFAEAHGTPYNYDGWVALIKKYGGYLPIEIKAVPEGTTVPTGNIMVSVENTDPEFYWLTSYVETALLRAVWYPTTVATNSREIKKCIADALDQTGDPAGIGFKLHDFGARGVSSYESAGIGGAAHLINFLGTDTITGALFAMKYYNTNEVPGFSIPAAEHSTMTTWGGREGEIDAMRNMLAQFAKPGGLVAVVSDSYDIYHAAKELWGNKLKQEVIDSGATIVVRPDSGHPATVVLEVLNLLADAFGYEVNEKGYMVLPPCIRVIQGDGINYDSINEIINVVTGAGFSMDNVVFGMGGALLQQLDRDTQRFAMKASAALVDGEWRDVFKDPITDQVKKSKKGRLTLVKDDQNNFRTVKLEEVGDQVDLLETVYYNGNIVKEYTFEEVRENAAI